MIPKQATPPPDSQEEDNILPQWAVAMISIGFLSLFFVVLFGVTVVSFLEHGKSRTVKLINNYFFQLVNRKKAAKKKAPTPLTADMLNELNKNHMGGLENFGAEDPYNLDDTWDERRLEPIKPKVIIIIIIIIVLTKL